MYDIFKPLPIEVRKKAYLHCAKQFREKIAPYGLCCELNSYLEDYCNMHTDYPQQKIMFPELLLIAPDDWHGGNFFFKRTNFDNREMLCLFMYELACDEEQNQNQ